jgi:hypothetical protein
MEKILTDPDYVSGIVKLTEGEFVPVGRYGLNYLEHAIKLLEYTDCDSFEVGYSKFVDRDLNLLLFRPVSKDIGKDIYIAVAPMED